jgi:hypothetical protein
MDTATATGYSIGDALIVVAITAGLLGYYYLKLQERRRRLEILHAERLAAMDKGIPLPELPLEIPAARPGPDPQVELILGIMLTAFGLGTTVALLLLNPSIWPMPLPVTLMGIGLILYHCLARPGRDDASSPHRGE